MKFPINRPCPLSGERSHRVLAYIPAKAIAAGNATYRPSFDEILSISPDDEFPIVENSAGFAFAGWLPPEDFLRRLYEDVIDHSKTVTQTMAYRAELLDLAAAFLSVVRRRTSALPLRLLDYGCGYGSLLRMFAGSEIQAFGYEPSAARQMAAGQGGIKIFNSLDQTAAAGPFDLIVCTEALEHLADPRAALRFMKQHASPRALLAVTVPDCERSYVKACLGGLATERRLPPVFNPWEHLNYFSAASLRRLLAEEGFTIVHDFGRAATVRDACAKFGDPGVNVFVNGLRILKRATTAVSSTQLFCELSRRP